MRHPVYTGEILSAFGLGLVLASPFTWVVLLSFVVAQVFRAQREEQLLEGVFPGYRAYRARTGMVLPRLLQAQRDPGHLVLHSRRGEAAHGGEELSVVPDQVA